MCYHFKGCKLRSLLLGARPQLSRSSISDSYRQKKSTTPHICKQSVGGVFFAGQQLFGLLGQLKGRVGLGDGTIAALPTAAPASTSTTQCITGVARGTTHLPSQTYLKKNELKKPKKTLKERKKKKRLGKESVIAQKEWTVAETKETWLPMGWVRNCILSSRLPHSETSCFYIQPPKRTGSDWTKVSFCQLLFQHSPSKNTTDTNKTHPVQVYFRIWVLSTLQPRWADLGSKTKQEDRPQLAALKRGPITDIPHPHPHSPQNEILDPEACPNFPQYCNNQQLVIWCFEPSQPLGIISRQH